MDYQRKGTCGHYMALVSVDPHDMCPGCRVCFVPDNPCLVCDALTSDQRAQSIQARRHRLRREERKRIARAGSIGSVSASGSSQCGPQERKGSGPPGSSLTSSVAGQGAGMPTPRSSRAESSSRAGNDGDNGGVTSRRPRSPDGGRDTSRGPWSPDGGSDARPVGSPHRGEETERRHQSHSPGRHRDSVSSESSDSSDAAGPAPNRLSRKSTGLEIDRTGPEIDRTGPEVDRTGHRPDRRSTGPEVDRTGPEIDRHGSGSRPDRKSTGPDRKSTGPDRKRPDRT